MRLTTDLTPVPVVRVAGEVDMDTAPRLAAHLSALSAAGHKRIVIDAGELTFIDSRGLSVLVTTNLQLIVRGGGLCLANPGSQALKAMRLTGMVGLIELHDSVELALKGAH